MTATYPLSSGDHKMKVVELLGLVLPEALREKLFLVSFLVSGVCQQSLLFLPYSCITVMFALIMGDIYFVSLCHHMTFL